MKKVSIKNWTKRTPKLLRRIGNTLIYIGLPSVIAAIHTLRCSNDTKLDLISIATFTFLAAKLLTKFFAEEPKK